jgi:hypothetical protein
MPAPPARSGDIYAQPRPLCFAGDLALDRGPGTSCSSSADVAGTGGELPQRKRSSMPKLHIYSLFISMKPCMLHWMRAKRNYYTYAWNARAKCPIASSFPLLFFLNPGAFLSLTQCMKKN